MLQLTEKAAQELRRVKAVMQVEEPGSVPRLIWDGEEFKLHMGVPEEGDQELYWGDEEILVVDPETNTALADVTLDYNDAPPDRGFVFERGDDVT